MQAWYLTTTYGTACCVVDRLLRWGSDDVGARRNPRFDYVVVSSAKQNCLRQTTNKKQQHRILSALHKKQCVVLRLRTKHSKIKREVASLSFRIIPLIVLVQPPPPPFTTQSTQTPVNQATNQPTNQKPSKQEWQALAFVAAAVVPMKSPAVTRHGKESAVPEGKAFGRWESRLIYCLHLEMAFPLRSHCVADRPTVPNDRRTDHTDWPADQMRQLTYGHTAPID